MGSRFLKLVVVLSALFGMQSCVSTRSNVLGPNEMANADVIGTVQTKFSSYHLLHLPKAEAVADMARGKLKVVADEKFPGGNIDVVNIRVDGGFHWGTVGIMLGWPFTIPLGNVQTINATGDVISLSGGGKPRTPARRPNRPQGLDSAIENVINSLMNDIPAGVKIAVVNIASRDRQESSLVIDELEFHLVSAKSFTIVDRSTLDAIRREQNFQMSGDVSDASAVAIGEMSGANVVIAGSINDAGGSKRLSIKALDVKTGQILAMAREQY